MGHMICFFSSFFMVLAGVLFWSTNAFALSLSPPVLEYSARPGDAVIDAVRVYNDGDKAVTIFPSSLNATDSGDELGTPKFYPVNQDINGQSMATWLSFERESFTLKPGEFFSHPFTINVPQDAVPGGHYAALVYSTVPPGRAKNVGVTTEIAALLLVDVAGEKSEGAAVSSILPTIVQDWYETLPTGFVVRIENTGTTHIKPVGGVKITNMIGLTVAYLPLNKNGGNVLPKTIRRFDVSGPGELVDVPSSLQKEIKDFGFGRYKATVSLGYGSQGQVIENSYVFYVLPWRLLIIAFVIVLVVGAAALIAKKKLQRPRIHQL